MPPILRPAGASMARVFLSYRQENDAHRAVVLALAKRLEQEGLTVVLDQLAQEREFNGGGPDEGWPKWSTDQAGSSDNKVVIIGTASWFRAFEGTEVAGVGLGSAAEAGVIRQRLYNVGGVNPLAREEDRQLLLGFGQCVLGEALSHKGKYREA